MQIRGDSLDTEDLLGMGKIAEVVELGARPETSNLDAAMSLFDRLNLRGEKTPCGDRRCLRAEWVGCL